jgi:hypothetical protein
MISRHDGETSYAVTIKFGETVPETSLYLLRSTLVLSSIKKRRLRQVHSEAEFPAQIPAILACSIANLKLQLRTECAQHHCIFHPSDHRLNSCCPQAYSDQASIRDLESRPHEGLKVWSAPSVWGSDPEALAKIRGDPWTHGRRGRTSATRSNYSLLFTCSVHTHGIMSATDAVSPLDGERSSVGLPCDSPEEQPGGFHVQSSCSGHKTRRLRDVPSTRYCLG